MSDVVNRRRGTNHVLAAGHEALVDHLCRIVAAGVNVDALLDDGVGACA